jgi:L-arabinose isomerase
MPARTVGCGLDTYWPQFAGLRDTLLDYQEVIRKHKERPGLNVIDAGLADDVPKSREIAASLRAAGIGLLVIYVATYFTVVNPRAPCQGFGVLCFY